MIKQNPFLSDNFINIWCKHFNSNSKTYNFDSLKGLSFFKFKFFPIYINIGKNLTKGMSYQISSDSSADSSLKNKVCLVYDVPQYFDTNLSTKNIKSKKIEQYPGFLITLENYNDFETYFATTFSKKTISRLRSYNRQLERHFSISYKMFYGSISKKEYDNLFVHFNRLLTKRFNNKKETNNNLNPNEWNFYYDVVYPLILEKKASLFVIYNEEKPIAIRLNYFSEDIIFDAIPVFDIEYSKFHLGKISIMKMLEWSFENNFKVYDFSKGFYDYKAKWSDKTYNFEYHLLYDSSSIWASLIATSLLVFYKLKQYLRDKNINQKLHKLLFKLKK